MSPKALIEYDRQNYRSLVLVGLGSVGQGVLAIGRECLSAFDDVVLLDIDPAACGKMRDKYGWSVIQADIEDAAFLTQFLSTLTTPILFVNLCSDIDTVKLRTVLRPLPVGYIDTCESRVASNDESRFSVSMPYTNQACHGRYPHLLCQGVNPGMAEYMARRMLHQMGPEQNGFAVSIYENDQLIAVDDSEALLVSWSPQDLIEEVLAAPAMRYLDKSCVEDLTPGGRLTTARWQGDVYPAWLVGHEDIWNLGQLPQVSCTQFLYTLSRPVMNVLRTGLRQARHRLRLPAENELIQGIERIVISVKHTATGRRRDLLWKTDHACTHDEYGINAVQFQTAASIVFSILMTQHTDLGLCAGTFNGSTLPLDENGWHVVAELMDRLDIHWVPVQQNYVSGVENNLSAAASESGG